MNINEKFSINTIKFPCNIVIIGTTDSGKTTILKHILLKIINKHSYDFLYLITNSKISVYNNNYLNYFFLNHIKYLDINNFKTELGNFLIQIKNFGNDLKIKKKWNGKIILIFDDVGEKLKLSLNNFTQECRHANISCIMLVHYYTHLPPSVRESVKYIFFTKTSLPSLKEFLPKKNARDTEKITNVVSTLLNKKKYIYCVYDSISAYFYYYIVDNYRELDNTDYVLKNTMSIIKKKIFNN